MESIGQKLTDQEIIEWAEHINSFTKDKKLSEVFEGTNARELSEPLMQVFFKAFALSLSRDSNSDEYMRSVGELMANCVFYGIYLGETNQSSLTGPRKELN